MAYSRQQRSGEVGRCGLQLGAGAAGVLVRWGGGAAAARPRRRGGRGPTIMRRRFLHSSDIRHMLHSDICQKLRARASPTVLAFHKPVGLTIEHGTRHCNAGPRTPLDEYMDEIAERHQPQGRLRAVGRLDKETSGLMVLTDDGLLTEQLNRNCTKIYEASVKLRAPTMVSAAKLQQLRDGVELTDGFARAMEAHVAAEWREMASLVTTKKPPREARSAANSLQKQARRHAIAAELHARRARAEGGEAEAAAAAAAAAAPSCGELGSLLDPAIVNASVVRLSVVVGRYRVVRRLLGSLDLPCFQLRRVAIGPLVLDHEWPEAFGHAPHAPTPQSWRAAFTPWRAESAGMALQLKPGEACALVPAQEEALRAACIARPCGFSGPTDVDGRRRAVRMLAEHGVVRTFQEVEE